MRKQLRNKTQCAKCPWKKSTNPHDIPNGYEVKRHERLKSTIADQCSIGRPLTMMACHETRVGEESFCIGWLMNQMGSGNNIGLRLKMMSYDLKGIKLDGPQHETFEATLPGAR